MTALTACLLALVPQTVTNPSVVVDVAERGTFTIELRRDKAPNTVEHFLWLIDEQFYDGILWHRLQKGFVLQTGDPTSKEWLPSETWDKPGERGGTVGLGDESWGPTIKFEKNDLPHDKWTIGMALEAPKGDSGSSHFFINLADNHRLNGNYVVFGKVTDGFDVVTKTKRGDLINSIRLKN